MTKTTLRNTLIAFTIVGLSPQLYAQDNAIKVNFISPIFKTASLFYERAINEEMSLQLNVFYRNSSVPFFNNLNNEAIGITPEFRYYLSDEGVMNGFYLGPYIRYVNGVTTSKSSSTKLITESISGGLLIGTEYVFKEIVVFDAFIGPFYTSGNTSVDGTGSANDYSYPTYSGFYVRGGLSIGIAF